jgi:hypothetical protein
MGQLGTCFTYLLLLNFFLYSCIYMILRPGTDNACFKRGHRMVNVLVDRESSRRANAIPSYGDWDGVPDCRCRARLRGRPVADSAVRWGRTRHVRGRRTRACVVGSRLGAWRPGACACAAPAPALRDVPDARPPDSGFRRLVSVTYVIAIPPNGRQKFWGGNKMECRNFHDLLLDIDIDI